MLEGDRASDWEALVQKRDHLCTGRDQSDLVMHRMPINHSTVKWSYVDILAVLKVRGRNSG